MKSRLMKEFSVEDFDIYTRDGVPARWGTFQDPWGNSLGFFEYIDQEEEKNRIKGILG